jgi:hypothetical protein
MTSLIELLQQHIGHPLTLVEPTPGRSLGLKCRCNGRVLDLSTVLGLRPGAVQTTSTSKTPERREPRGDEQCPAHIGEWRHNCRPCASDAKAIPDGQSKTTTTRAGSDPTQHPDWQAARARFGGTR